MPKPPPLPFCITYHTDHPLTPIFQTLWEAVAQDPDLYTGTVHLVAQMEHWYANRSQGLHVTFRCHNREATLLMGPREVTLSFPAATLRTPEELRDVPPMLARAARLVHTLREAISSM